MVDIIPVKFESPRSPDDVYPLSRGGKSHYDSLGNDSRNSLGVQSRAEQSKGYVGRQCGGSSSRPYGSVSRDSGMKYAA